MTLENTQNNYRGEAENERYLDGRNRKRRRESVDIVEMPTEVNNMRKRRGER